MPEGPEIRRAADTVARALVNRPTTEVFFAFDHLKPYAAELRGATVTAVDTFGKAMVTRFDNGLSIYSHNQLYGQWKVRRPYDFPDTKRQLRLAIHNDKKSALLYSASDIEVLPEGELESHPFLSRIGPDLLDERVTAEHLIGRFVSDRFKRRRLASLLLDQHFLAGVGNYLRSEILFVGRTHPLLRPVDCKPHQIESLATAAIELARQSYRTGGITNDLALVQKLKAQRMLRRYYRHWVFGRENRPCYLCGTPIQKEMMAGRRIYFCPQDQPRP